ncbi:hypothetical protein GH733_014405 [Mirounga leonina]|nr:hypothetical protein GH733_014405 [Mirounga leonina]
MSCEKGTSPGPGTSHVAPSNCCNRPEPSRGAAQTCSFAGEKARGLGRPHLSQRRRDLPEVGNFLELEANRKTSAPLLFPLCSGYLAPRDPLLKREGEDRVYLHRPGLKGFTASEPCWPLHHTSPPT